MTARPAARRASVGAVAVALSILLGVPSVLAIGTRPCEQPRVFEGAAVNAVILPYRYEGPDQGDRAKLREVGERLSAMVQLEVLFAMLKYGSVGTTRLSSSPGGTCDPDAIVERLTQGESGAVRPGNGLVLMWGRIYLEGEQVYLRSYLRFLRRDAEETIDVDLGPPSSGLRLLGRLPAQGVSFSPRAVTLADLGAIEEASRKSLVVRPTRDENAPGAAFEVKPRAPFAATVADAQGDWMRLESMTGGPSGWVRARADGDKWGLRHFLPELGFFDAVVGYLRLNAAQPSFARQAPEAYRWVTDALSRYEEAAGPEAPPAALGLSRTLRGFLLWKGLVPGGPSPRRDAAALFAQGLNFTPHYPEARNLAAITEPFRGEGAASGPMTGEAQRRLGGDLLGALAVDAHNPTVLDNLERFYRFAQAQPTATPLYPDLPERLDVIRAARAARH